MNGKRDEETRESKIELERLVLAPVDIRISVDADFIRFVKDRLSASNPILKKGEVHMCKMLGHKVPFEVVEISPEQGVIGEYTVLEILSNPTPKETKKRIKCYMVKSGEVLTIGPGESIYWRETGWKIVDGEKVPDSLVVWTESAYEDEGVK